MSNKESTDHFLPLITPENETICSEETLHAPYACGDSIENVILDIVNEIVDKVDSLILSSVSSSTENFSEELKQNRCVYNEINVLHDDSKNIASTSCDSQNYSKTDNSYVNSSHPLHNLIIGNADCVSHIGNLRRSPNSDIPILSGINNEKHIESISHQYSTILPVNTECKKDGAVEVSLVQSEDTEQKHSNEISEVDCVVEDNSDTPENIEQMHSDSIVSEGPYYSIQSSTDIADVELNKSSETSATDIAHNHHPSTFPSVNIECEANSDDVKQKYSNIMSKSDVVMKTDSDVSKDVQKHSDNKVSECLSDEVADIDLNESSKTPANNTMPSHHPLTILPVNIESKKGDGVDDNEGVSGIPVIEGNSFVKSNLDISQDIDQKHSDNELSSEMTDAELNNSLKNLSMNDIMVSKIDTHSIDVKCKICLNHRSHIMRVLEEHHVDFNQNDLDITCFNKKLEMYLSSLLSDNKSLTLANGSLLSQLSETEKFSRENASKLKRMEQQTVALEKELSVAKKRISDQELSAKEAILSVRSEAASKLQYMEKQRSDAVREKDSMVVKYAQAEQKAVYAQSEISKLQIQAEKASKERNALFTKIKSLNAEIQKVFGVHLDDLNLEQIQLRYEERAKEVTSLEAEVAEVKRLLSTADVKLKWAHNKMRAEIDAHQITKNKLGELTRKLHESKEECEIIRRESKQMVKKYQELEELKSSTLSEELEKREEELLATQQEQSDQEQTCLQLEHEMKEMTTKLKDSRSLTTALSEKVKNLDTELTSTQSMLQQCKTQLDLEKKMNVHLKEKNESVQALQTKYDKSVAEISTLKDQLQEMKNSNSDYESDIATCKRREAELLEYMQRLTDESTSKLTDNHQLKTQVDEHQAEIVDLKKRLKIAESQLSIAEASLNSKETKVQKESNSHIEQLLSKDKAISALTVQVQDLQDEIRTLRRKHQANVKDLTRQLQVATKHSSKNINGSLVVGGSDMNNGSERASAGEVLSICSRTSSIGSLDSPGTNGTSSARRQDGSQDGSIHSPTNEINLTDMKHVADNAVYESSLSAQSEEMPMTRTIEPSRQLLIERIVKLQRMIARRNEKIDFLEDHTNNLLTEIKKKSKLLQSYLLREESGALSPLVMDENKEQLSKRGAGIMSSVYRGSSLDPGMTLDLSLSINRKLQAVLEDTLLKNIMLKESIETLGLEIAKLSKENRQIKLQLGGDGNNRAEDN